jgi:Leucine-rich repeat (LRR) protein
VATNELESIPDKIGFLEDLRTLNLNFNSLSAIPSTLGFLKKLEVSSTILFVCTMTL